MLGHEIIGHREAELAGQARIEPWHEEFQASTRAALHTPDLPREQMWLLTQDAAAARRHQSREGTIFVDTERYGPPQPGGRRRQAASRAPDAPPSVIVDPALGGARPGWARPASRCSAGHHRRRRWQHPILRSAGCLHLRQQRGLHPRRQRLAAD